MTYRAPLHYSTPSQSLPSPSSRPRKPGTQTHVQRPASPAFLDPGMGKITRCPGSTHYQEYLFNPTPLFILLLLLDPHNPHADLSVDMDPFWTVTRRLVFVLHSFSLGFSSHFVVVFGGWLYQMKCIIVEELRHMNPFLDPRTCVYIRQKAELPSRAVIDQAKDAQMSCMKPGNSCSLFMD